MPLLTDDALISIVLYARSAYMDVDADAVVGGEVDAVTLSSLLLTCRRLNACMRRHWAVIVDHYTVTYHSAGTSDSELSAFMHEDAVLVPAEVRIGAGKSPVDMATDWNADLTQKLFCGRFHCVDGPAVIRGARREYHVYGQLHRGGDLPAIETPATCEWYYRGQRHRDGKPAVVAPDSVQYWKKGNLHRKGDLPALIERDGDYVQWGWYRNGMQHRDWMANGPAMIRMRMPEGSAVPSDSIVAMMYTDGGNAATPTTTYCDHAECGTAAFTGCALEWWQYGRLHREGRPARIISRQRLEYHRFGKLHREAGPALVYADGIEYCYIDGLPTATAPRQ